jgi:choice-of-anchor B domain-containing protein
MNKALILIFLFPFVLFSQIKNVTLLDQWSDTSLITNSSSVRYSGCFSFVYEASEYAVIGSTEGAHIFKITSENQLHFIDKIEGSFVSSQAITREYGVHNNYLYAIGDEGSASLQIIDLTFLPDSVVLSAEIQDDRVGKAHNIYIDSLNELMYLCSVTPIVSGQEVSLIPLRVFSLENPLSPIIIFDGFNDLDEVHDIEIRDQFAIMNCGYQGIRIYDFTNPATPVYINNLEFYQEQGYNHQGSLSSDGKVYVFADETPGTRIKKCSVGTDYTIQVEQFFGVENSPYDKTAHNIEILGDLAYVAYYNEGLRVYDLRTNPPTEVAAYDTHTDLAGNEFSMWGAWGIEADISKNRVLVSDRISGFYLFEFDREFFEQVISPSSVSCFPNPVYSGEYITVRSANDQITTFSITLVDDKGKEVLKEEITDKSYTKIHIDLAQGTYFLRIEFTDELFLNREMIKIIVL